MCRQRKPWRVRYVYLFDGDGEFIVTTVAYKSEANARRAIATERFLVGDALKSVQVYREVLLT